VSSVSQQGPWFTEFTLSASVSQMPFWIYPLFALKLALLGNLAFVLAWIF
jgi:hypothetical protein